MELIIWTFHNAVGNIQNLLESQLLMKICKLIVGNTNCISNDRDIIIKEMQLKFGFRKLLAGIDNILSTCAGKVIDEAVEEIHATARDDQYWQDVAEPCWTLN
jgi:hypothetical protein